jgi:inner membrane protein
MDNLTHSLVGLTCAKAGLERLSPYATIVCVTSANIADADFLSLFVGDRWTLLHYHRGITHSIVGTIAIGFLIPTFALVIERAAVAVRRRKSRIRFGGLLVASMIAAATHPLLDWTNNYGVRPLLPWSGRWFYGDLVYIVDPYIWLLLGVPAFLLTSNTRARLIGWSVLAVCAAMLMGLASRALNSDSGPLRVALVIWIAVASTAGVLRAYGAPQRFGSRLAFAALLVLVTYWAALGLVHRAAAADSGRIAEHLATVRGERFLRVAAMPTAASAFRWQSVAETDRAIYRFMIRLGSTSTDSADGPVTRYVKPLSQDAALVRMAGQDRGAQTLLDFARFPLAQVDADNCVGQTLVQFADLRYTEPGHGRANFSVNVPVDCPAR